MAGLSWGALLALTVAVCSCTGHYTIPGKKGYGVEFTWLKGTDGRIDDVKGNMLVIPRLLGDKSKIESMEVCFTAQGEFSYDDWSCEKIQLDARYRLPIQRVRGLLPYLGTVEVRATWGKGIRESSVAEARVSLYAVCEMEDPRCEIFTKGDYCASDEAQADECQGLIRDTSARIRGYKVFLDVAIPD